MLTGALLVLSLLQATTTAGGLVEGRAVTRAAGDYAPLPYATISARSLTGVDHRTRYATTDDAGYFRFEALPDGSYLLRAVHPGYVPADVEVVLAGGRSVSVDLILSVRPVGLDPVVVRADAGAPTSDSLGDPDVSLAGEDAAAVSLRAMEVGSGMAASGMTGLFPAVPGNDPADPTDALFMRGSAMDLKVVLLDGAPLYTPFHVSGLLPAFDPALLEAAHLYNGGAPAEFDGGLSHVLDMRTRPARRDGVHARGSADLMSARVGAEASLGSRAGVTFGARALHAAAERILDRTGFPYGYVDGIVRFDLRPATGHTLSVTGFKNEESVRLDYREMVTPGQIQEAASVSPLPTRSTWGNEAVTAGYEADLGRTSVRARAAVSQYEAELPLRGESPLFASGATDRVRLAFDFARRGGDASNSRWAAGATLDAVDVQYLATRLTEGGGDLESEVRTTATGSVAAAYVEGAMQVHPQVRFSAGLRAASYERTGTRVGPRLGVTWLLSDDAAFSIKGGRSHQLTTNSDAAVETALGLGDAGVSPPTEPAIPAGAGALVSVASSTHLVVGLDQLLSERTRLGIEGWARRYEGIGVQGVENLNGSGFDLRVARAGESLDGWLGYSLTWYWADEVAASDPFSGRHLLSAGLMGDLGSQGRFNVQLALGDGLPFTAVSVADAAAPSEGDFDRGTTQRPSLDTAVEQARGGPVLTGGPSGDFLRLDGELSWRIETDWRGRSVELRPYVRVLNALNRRDALFYYFEPWRDLGPRPLAELSIVPVVGLSWRF